VVQSGHLGVWGKKGWGAWESADPLQWMEAAGGTFLFLFVFFFVFFLGWSGSPAGYTASHSFHYPWARTLRGDRSPLPGGNCEHETTARSIGGGSGIRTSMHHRHTRVKLRCVTGKALEDGRGSGWGSRRDTKATGRGVFCHDRDQERRSPSSNSS